MEKLNLEIILNNITFTSAEDCPTSGGFEKILQKHMPGYDITVFDMDEDHYTSPGDTIAVTVKNQFVEDIQTMQWCTEEQDAYYYIVAIKLKGE